MGVTIQAVYMAIKQGRLTAITDNQGKTVINSDTMHQEWTGKSAFRKMKNIQAATIEQPVTKRKISKTSDSTLLSTSDKNCPVPFIFFNFSTRAATTDCLLVANVLCVI